MHICELLLNLQVTNQEVFTNPLLSSYVPRTTQQQHLSKDTILRLNNRPGLISSTDHVMNFPGDLNLTSATADDRIMLRIHPFPPSFLLLLLLLWRVEI